MTEFDYSNYGRVQTGFDNSIDHSLFGHHSNPEYQQLCQDEEYSYRNIENNERDYEEYKELLNQASP